MNHHLRRGYDPQILTQQKGEAMSKYRLLHEGDTVQEDDEILQSDGAIWLKVSRGLFGEKYYSTDFNPMRRPIEGEPAPEQKGLPVRIAVAVEFGTGNWSSYGRRFDGEERSDADKMRFASRVLGEASQLYWIEAVIPITEPPVIHGRVEADDG